jgi:hypothetical protein
VTPELLAVMLAFFIVIYGIVAWISYFIVKWAVRKAIIEAHHHLNQ